jgi:hypothetical protein
MARLQIVQLPATPENPAPYLVVIDDLTPEQADSLPDKTLDMTTIVGCAGAFVWGLGQIAVPTATQLRWVNGADHGVDVSDALRWAGITGAR